MSKPQLHGVLLIDKPVDITSFDVIRRMRRILKTRKIGHAGTLDPFATGLLVLCVGDYTRFAGYLTDDDKRYLATLQLGVETNTDDCEGEITSQGLLPAGWPEQLPNILPRFRGKISQVPPAFSAIHIDGKRAYALARKGEEVNIPARDVTIHTLDVLGYGESTVELDVIASKGTYIRALARDIGREMGCGGHLSALRRVRSGHFTIDDAFELDALQALVELGDLKLLQGRDALPGFESIELNETELLDLKNGKLLPAPEAREDGIYAAYDQAEDALQGLVEVVAQSRDDAEETDAPTEEPARVLKVKRLLPTG